MARNLKCDSIRVGRPLGGRTTGFRPDQLEVQRSCNTPGDGIVELKEVGEVGTKTVGPNGSCRTGVDEFGIGLHPRPDPSDATFQNVANAEFASDLAHVNGFSLVGKGCCPCNHQSVGEAA
jgi:hypothetical protein